MTYRHAVKDADNNVPFGETLPVHYNALAGLTVEETESGFIINDVDIDVSAILTVIHTVNPSAQMQSLAL